MSQNQSIIEHKANMYYVEFREDYLLLCQNCTYTKPPTEAGTKSHASPHCKALILAILERWTNDKRGKDKRLAIYMTYPQWGAAMYGMFGRCVIIDSLEELIGEKLIERHSCKIYDKSTYQYILNYREVNRRMRDLPDRDPHVVEPQVNPSQNRCDTRPKVDEAPSKNRRDCRLKIDEAASKSRRNIESTENQNRESTEREEAIGSTISPTVASPQQESSLSPASPSLADSSASKPDVPSSQDVAPGWNAIACRDRFYALSGIRPRLPKQLDEDAALAAQVYQTTSEIECTTAYTNMKADPYWKPKNFSFNTFVKHLPEYLHTPSQEKSNGNTAPSKRSLGGPPSEKPDAATNERNTMALLARHAARQAVAAASQQQQTA